MYLLDPTQKASNREIYKPEAICLFGLLYPNHSFDLDIDSPAPIPTPKPKPVTYDSSGEDDDEVALANFSPKSVDDWIALFLREEKVPASEYFNLCAWWGTKKDKYPPLYELFLDISPAQATSCHSERAASIGKRILTERGNCLSNVEILII